MENPVILRNSEESESRRRCWNKITESELTNVWDMITDILGLTSKDVEVTKLIRCYEHSNKLKGEDIKSKIISANKQKKLIWIKKANILISNHTFLLKFYQTNYVIYSWRK